jgi:alkylated DNA repair dioxygenase AlkB
VPSPQLALFGATETPLADDANGRIVYTPAFVEEALAAAWFAALRDGVDWRAERRWMYDREVDVPRLTARFRLEPREALLDAVGAAATRVLARTGAPFNSVGLNFYRDGKDSVAPHNDHLDELVEGSPIALLSLGSTRRMTIRAKQPPRRVLRVDLEPGSLLLMSYATQLHYTHGIPKTAEAVGPRISVVFRVRPAQAPGDDERGGYYS